jgi:hypothetical protein
MADKGFITIYKQSLAAEAASSSNGMGNLPGGKVTAAALGGGRDGGHNNGVVALSGGSQPEPVAMLHTSREAAVAAVCKQVAVNGFEPISDAFSLPRW